MSFVPKDFAISAVVLNANVAIFAARHDNVVGAADGADSAGVDVFDCIKGGFVEIEYFDMSEVVSHGDFGVLFHETH